MVVNFVSMLVIGSEKRGQLKQLGLAMKVSWSFAITRMVWMGESVESVQYDLELRELIS